MPPTIGITTRTREVKSSAGVSDAHTLERTYTDGVLRSGGTPVLLAPVPDTHISRLLDRIDGLILTGGGDIDPSRYGGKHHKAIYGTDFDRDEFEIELVREAAARRLPTLAICRGLQVVNVALGGTLIEDIPSEVGSSDHWMKGQAVLNGHQHVQLDPTCLIARVIDDDVVGVNSIHHQSVRDLAPGLKAVGWANDGVVEAIEHDDDAWGLLAVQWHPEYLDDANDASSRALFKALIEASSAHRAMA